MICRLKIYTLRLFKIIEAIMYGGEFDDYFTPMHEIIAPIDGKGGLYLGNIQAARSHDILDKKGIGCVVTVVFYQTSNKLVPDTIVKII